VLYLEIVEAPKMEPERAIALQQELMPELEKSHEYGIGFGS
jgi:hypothetical protein